jgi:hypothetical protein
MAITTSDLVNDSQLQDELASAGIDVDAGIGTEIDGAVWTVSTYDGSGTAVDLPEAAQVVVDAHDAVVPVDPRIAVIENMESLTDADKAALIGLIVG